MGARYCILYYLWFMQIFLLPRQAGAWPQVDGEVDSPARSLQTRLELHRPLVTEDPHEVGGVGEDDVVGEVEVTEGGQ